MRDFRYAWTLPDGRTVYCSVSGKPVFDERGAFRGYRGTGTNVTAEVDAEERLRQLSLYDPLTGLPNRVLLAERLDHALARVHRHGGLAAVLCLDLDRFKQVNDTLGHATGDLLLKAVTERLRACVRGSDTVARLGGDEFAVVQTEIAGAADAEALCRRLLACFEAPFALDGHEAFVGTSIGVAVAPVDGTEPGALLMRADIALYRAKEERRGGFRFFEAGMDARLQARKALEADLRRALERGEIELHYQPRVAVDTGRVAGVEALARWRHPERGAVPPGEFIPLAEETGLILPLGEWILRTACAQAAGWPGVQVSVNLSPVQVRHPDLPGLVRRALADAGLEPGRLEVDVAEGVLLRDPDAALPTLTALKAQGVRIAVDDFGSGYSSLSCLQRFPFDALKIDRTLIAQLGGSADAAAVVQAVVTLGRGLGLRTTAEGVERADQLAFLGTAACDDVQGYFCGPPEPAAKIDCLLRHEGTGGARRAPGRRRVRRSA